MTMNWTKIEKGFLLNSAFVSKYNCQTNKRCPTPLSGFFVSILEYQAILSRNREAGALLVWRDKSIAFFMADLKGA